LVGKAGLDVSDGAQSISGRTLKKIKEEIDG